MVKLKLQLFAQKLNTKQSVVDYLKSQGQDSSMSARKELAKSLGISNYSGSYDQNVQMLNMLKNSSASSTTQTPAPKAAPPASNNNVSGNTQTSINGVDQATIDKMNSTFTASDTVNNAQAEANASRDKLKEISSVTDIVDQATWDTLNSKFSLSSTTQQAWDYTNQLLQQLSSGKTSYSDEIDALMNDIRNRDKFEYDVDSDVLFQQSLASAMSSGKTAMQDTMGQASALTGGYGSTYATSAANQSYNAFIEDAYNNLPEYYQMALEAYQMEGEEMYNQLAMLNDASNTEWGRLYDSWNANFSNAQQLYQNEYSAWQDTVNNAYNSANLQLNEYGQLYDMAYNTYNSLQDYAQTMYQNEYNSWADQVNNAFKYADLANSDYWSTQNFIEGQRQFNESLAWDKESFGQEMGYKYSALAQDQAQHSASLAQENAQFLAKNDVNGDGVVDSKDLTAKATTSELREPSETQMKKALEAYNTGGDDALYQYVDSLGSDIDMDKIDAYIFGDGTSNGYGVLPLEKRTFTKTNDTTNWFWGDDNNDVVVDQYGNTYRIDELPESLRKELTKLKKDESYTAK